MSLALEAINSQGSESSLVSDLESSLVSDLESSPESDVVVPSEPGGQGWCGGRETGNLWVAGAGVGAAVQRESRMGVDGKCGPCCGEMRQDRGQPV